MCSLLVKIIPKFFKILIILLIGLFLPVFAKCEDECLNVKNADSHNFYKTEKTFVSISPAMTEIMYALGAEGSLIAVSNYCTYPKAAKDKEKIGSGYAINEEKILKLKPDYILALDISEALLNKFRRLKITPLCFKYPDIQAVYNNILTIGKLTGKEQKAKEVVEFSKQKIVLAKRKAKNEGRAGKRVLYLVQARPMIAIGKKSFITDIIEQSGNHSVTAGLNSYYPVILEEYAIKLRPDIVVLSHFTDINEVKKFFPNTRIVKMGAEQNDIINRPGPRVYKGVEFFAGL